MLFVSKKSKNNWILHRGHVCLAGKADNAWQSETCRSWEVSLVSGQLKSPRAQLSTPTEHVSPSRWITTLTHWESPQGRDGKGPDPVKKPKLCVQTGCWILKNTPEPCDLLVPSHTQIQSCPSLGHSSQALGTLRHQPEESVLSPELFSRPQSHRATSHFCHRALPAQLIQSSLGDPATSALAKICIFTKKENREVSSKNWNLT